MKVLAINGSSNAAKGNTALILEPFLDGAREAGAEVELFYTKKLNIKPCRGEFHCWFKKPGDCFQKDDMQVILPAIAAADVLVFATPVYVDGVSGPLKNLIDRMIPILEPIIELREDHCRYRARRDVPDGKLVLVASCGFWELDNFDPMLVHMRAISKNFSREFAGALLRPHGAVLREVQEKGAPVDDVREAARKAGRQLARDGRMRAETLEIVSWELLSQKMYVDIANQRIQTALDKLEIE